MPYSCYWLHTVQFAFVATLLTVQYSLPHAMQFAICCRYLLPHDIQLLRVATCRIVCYLMLLSVAACHTVGMCCCILCSHHFVAACRVVATYLLLHAVQLPFVATEVGASICCHRGGCLHLLPHAVELLFCCY